jgi:hypothetical protein
MHFDMKSYLKSTRNHIIKYALILLLKNSNDCHITEVGSYCLIIDLCLTKQKQISNKQFPQLLSNILSSSNPLLVNSSYGL